VRNQNNLHWIDHVIIQCCCLCVSSWYKAIHNFKRFILDN